ncbi:MAG: nuclear transport factor 2 family protein [Gammaproteobacteria bacterium]
MKRLLTATVLCLWLSLPAQADERITREHIQQVIRATDAAALNRDAAGIGAYLGQSFERIIEFAYKDWMAKIRLDRDKYLEMINEGWQEIGDYSYQRDNIEIHIAPDGRSGLSYSTVTEHMVQDGKEMISRFREHATYELEDGRPVITQVSGHTLLGDTTPQ